MTPPSSASSTAEMTVTFSEPLLPLFVDPVDCTAAAAPGTTSAVIS